MIEEERQRNCVIEEIRDLGNSLLSLDMAPIQLRKLQSFIHFCFGKKLQNFHPQMQIIPTTSWTRIQTGFFFLSMFAKSINVESDQTQESWILKFAHQ